MRAGGEDVKAGDPVKLDDFSNRKLTSFLHERWICPVSQEDDDDQTGQVGGNNQLPPSNLYVKKLGRGRYVVMEGDQALTGEMLEGEAQRELQKYLE